MAGYARLPFEYVTEAIQCRQTTTVSRNVLHYCTVVDLLHEVRLVVPTQGKLACLGELEMATGRKQIWAYLRKDRRPFFIVFDIYGDGFVDTVDGDTLPAEFREEALHLARTTHVYDRRHIRFEDDFPTPGKMAEEVEVHLSLLQATGALK